MRFTFSKLTVVFTAALLSAPMFGASNVHRAPAPPSSRRSTSKTASKTAKTTRTTKTSKTSSAALRRASASRRPKGQQSIQPDRVTQIQEALIREHYLTGEPNGNWDASTEAAMQKLQADQGWQTRLMPDSRALKKLGLGPDYSGAINAKNSSFAEPPPISTIPNEQASGFTAASGVNQ